MGDLAKPKAQVEDGIRERLAELVDKFSQAGVARAGEVNESSVHHYVRGRRVPADFCVRVAEGLGVSLNWLLTGAGNAEAGEGALEADRASESMEQLVRILGALQQEAEGSLAGTPTVKRLERLNGLLRTWNDAQGKLRGALTPVTQRLVESLDDALARHNLIRASDIAPGLEYLRRFDLDGALLNRIDLGLSRFAFLDLDYEKSYALRKKILWRYLLDGGDDPRRVLEFAFTVVHSAYGIGRHAEALSIADAVLAATRVVPDGDVQRLRMRIVRSSCLVETGRIPEAVSELSDAIPRLPTELRDKYWGLHVRTLVLAGAMRIEPAFAVIESYEHRLDDTALFTMAMLQGDEGLLERALKFAEKTGAVHPDPGQPTNSMHVKCLLQAIRGEPEQAVKRWFDAVDNLKGQKNRAGFLRFYEVELLRAGGKPRTAQVRLRQFWKKLDEGKGAPPPGFFSLASVYRETLLLERKGSPLRSRARSWLRKKVREGYAFFRDWLDDAQ